MFVILLRCRAQLGAVHIDCRTPPPPVKVFALSLCTRTQGDLSSKIHGLLSHLVGTGLHRRGRRNMPTALSGCTAPLAWVQIHRMFSHKGQICTFCQSGTPSRPTVVPWLKHLPSQYTNRYHNVNPEITEYFTPPTT